MIRIIVSNEKLYLYKYLKCNFKDLVREAAKKVFFVARLLRGGGVRL